MRLDRQRLVQVGVAVLVAILAAVFGLSGGGSKDAPSSGSTASINDEGPAAAPASADTSPAVAETTPAVKASMPSASKPAVPVSTGDFDYFLLVLSWSPTHCSSDAGRGRDDDLQCRSGRPYGFVLHGLWPQNERGWPEHCDSQERQVSASNMRAALKLSPSEKLVEHEWEKHGTCAGLSQDDYFAAAALAVDSVKVPAPFQAPAKPLVTTADEVRRQFLQANRGFPNDGISATCNRNELSEVWVCLDKGLQPRSCSAEVRRKHCGGRQVRMLSVRGDWPR